LGEIHQIIAANYSMQWVPGENRELAFFSPSALTSSVPADSLQCNSLQRRRPWGGGSSWLPHSEPHPCF